MVDKYLSMRPSATNNLERTHAVFGNITASIDNCSKSWGRLKQVEPQSSELDWSHRGDLPNRFRVVGGVTTKRL